MCATQLGFANTSNVDGYLVSIVCATKLGRAIIVCAKQLGCAITSNVGGYSLMMVCVKQLGCDTSSIVDDRAVESGPTFLKQIL